MKLFCNVSATKLPDRSLLQKRISASDFVDCFAVDADLSVRDAANLITDFPSWGKFLLTIRRLLTTPFGLSNDGPEADDKVGPFPVELETDQELIAGFNDSHLNFRVSVMRQNQKMFLATWVHPHNVFGWAYLWLIYPFHVLIARDALARVARACD